MLRIRSCTSIYFQRRLLQNTSSCNQTHRSTLHSKAVRTKHRKPRVTASSATGVGMPAVDTQYTVPHAKAAWEFFRSLGSPKYHVAPMVDQVLSLPSVLASETLPDSTFCRYTSVVFCSVLVSEISAKHICFYIPSAWPLLFGTILLIEGLTGLHLVVRKQLAISQAIG